MLPATQNAFFANVPHCRVSRIPGDPTQRVCGQGNRNFDFNLQHMSCLNLSPRKTHLLSLGSLFNGKRFMMCFNLRSHPNPPADSCLQSACKQRQSRRHRCPTAAASVRAKDTELHTPRCRCASLGCCGLYPCLLLSACSRSLKLCRRVLNNIYHIKQASSTEK